MWKSQSWLVVFFVAYYATVIESIPQTDSPNLNLIKTTNKIDNDLPMAANPKYNKMLPMPNIDDIKKMNKERAFGSAESTASSTITTAKNLSKFTTRKKETGKIPLAMDHRFNKMLPQTNILKDEHKDNNLVQEEEDDYSDVDDYNYDEDYGYDDNDNKTSNVKVSAAAVVENFKKNEEKLKPIKGIEKATATKNSTLKTTDEEVDDDTDDDDDDEYDDDDDITDEEEIVYNQNVPCPRDCICARNLNSYLVATCSRLDAGVQKFGSDISDLVVVDIGPKYPILLSQEFFVKIGLKHVSSIKISNCTVEMIHPSAFHGLEELFSVNLTNVGLSMIYPQTFEKNKRLRLLTISGNDLNVMSHRGAPGSKYLLMSTTIEELDLSNNNLNELQPTAFNKLTNIVYINLSQNNIKRLPETIFDSVETIEELDLSSNSIITLPPNIFNRTALAILHLKYNDITGDLGFGTADLQQLDLSFNTIKHINNHMFAKMDGLTMLNVKGNGLIKIQPDSFVALKNLRHIDLSFNDLDQVSSLLFYRNNDLDVIRLNDNPKLSELPTDGFQSVTGDFSVYLLDVSNCAIGALGQKTFATMPRLTTLKLSWNNINNLEKGIFMYSERLTELDLSNNLIVKLDDLMFIRNKDLSKLNLAGNPIRELSANLFIPFNNLKELDVSDCELHSMLNNNYKHDDNKILESLRSFNVSYNKIKKINKDEIQRFASLKTFDIHGNPLKCNEDFRGLMKYLAKKNIGSGKIAELANLDDSFALPAHALQGWDELATNVCKHASDVFKLKEKLIEIKKSTTIQPLIAKSTTDKKSEKENDADENEEDDSDEYDENNYDDDNNSDDKEIDLNAIKHKPVNSGKIEVDEIDIIKETEDKFLRGKLLDDDSELADGEEIVIERGKIYYVTYKFLITIIMVILTVIVLLLSISKIVSIIMRKRGERYRMAILASKNSIVYQKLSEDIAAQNYKIPKNPKVHRYARINEV